MCNWVLEVQDIISIIATGGVLIIGFLGLSTWKKQLKGKTEYELSRRTLVGLLAYKQTIKNVRNSVFLNDERPAPPDDKKENMSEDEQAFYGKEKAYEKRWDKVNEERNKLYPDELEAEALWGKGDKKYFKALYDLEHELARKVRQHLVLIDPKTSQELKKAMTKLEKETRDILYDESNDNLDQEDEFQTEISEAIDKFAEYLKPHLKI